jgi:hypothetical protein
LKSQVSSGRNQAPAGNGRGSAQAPAEPSPRHIAPNEPNLSPRRLAGLDVPPMLGVIVPNEANLPFDSSGRGRREVGGGVVVVTACTNEPNFRRPGYPTIPLFQRSNPMPIVRNKANPPRAVRRASTFRTKSYGTLDTQKASAKQSQFLRGWQWARAGKVARAAGGTLRAKRS